MSSRPRPNGHTPAEGWTPVEYSHRPRASAYTYTPANASLDDSASIQRRRAAAARARRRRLLLIDLALGLALALAAIVIAPGLAIVALFALIGLLACAGSVAYGRLRRGATRRPRAYRGRARSARRSGA